MWNVRSAQSFIMWWKRNVTPSGRRLTKAFCSVNVCKIAAVFLLPVTVSAISTVNSSARPMTAKNSRRFDGSGSIIAAENIA